MVWWHSYFVMPLLFIFLVMIRNNKLSSFLDRCTNEREMKPITADIFLTDFCNEKCSYCRYSHSSGDYMRYDDFVLYANRLIDLGVRGFILTGGGEPTINKDFEKIIGYLESNNIPYGVNTNFKKYVEMNPVYLKVSIDTGDECEYKNIRGVDALEQVLSNLKRFCEYKKTNNNNTNIGVQCIASTKENVISFYNKVKYLNVDYIYYRPLEKQGRGNNNVVDLRNWLNEYNILDSRINISYKFDLANYYPKKCYSNFCNICINTHGDVIYCCHMPNDIVGHIMDDDILLKKSIYQIDMSKCEHPCRLSGSNKYMEELKYEQDIFFI